MHLQTLQFYRRALRMIYEVIPQKLEEVCAPPAKIIFNMSFITEVCLYILYIISVYIYVYFVYNKCVCIFWHLLGQSEDYHGLLELCLDHNQFQVHSCSTGWEQSSDIIVLNHHTVFHENKYLHSYRIKKLYSQCWNLKKKIVCVCLRESWGRERGRGETFKQTVCWARSLRQGLIPTPWSDDLSQNQELEAQPTEPTRRPSMLKFLIAFTVKIHDTISPLTPQQK